VKRTQVLLVVLAWSLVQAGVASAHAQLVRSDPADGAVLVQAPTSVRLVFDDAVRPASGMRAIENGGGSVLDGQPRLAKGSKRVLVVPLRPGLGRGDYTVLWRVVSDDGHTIAGVLAFAVGAGRAPPQPTLTAGNGRSASDVIERWLLFGGLLAAVGSAVFIHGVLRRTRLAKEAERRALARLHGAMAIGFILFVFGIAPQIHHDPFDTRFGFALSIGAIGATIAGTLAAIAVADPPLRVPAALIGGPLIAVPSFAGHALDAGRPWFTIVVDLVHITAAAVWLGGLLSLVLILPLLRGDPALREVGRRFSILTLCAVATVAATGVVRAFGELSALSQVWSSSYGRLLIVKTILLALLAALGWVNRYRLVPRLGNDPRTPGLLRRNVGGELLLFAGLITAVALLTDTRPGRDLARAAPRQTFGKPVLPPADAFVAAREDGRLAVALALRPSGVAQVTAIGPDGLGVDGLSVAVTVRGTTAQTRSCGHGCYRSPFSGPPRRVDVIVNGKTLVFPAPARWPPRTAAGIIRRATRAFRRASSVAYDEHLASSPQNAIDTMFVMERPNKLTYHIKGGASAIVIGKRRWDRTPGKPWRSSPQPPLHLPAPPWVGPITNAHVLRREPGLVVVTMLDRGIPAWFTLWLDARSLLPSRLAMTATAHFMKHRYTAFNRPIGIRPPG
jgi:copper transport protein